MNPFGMGKEEKRAIATALDGCSAPTFADRFWGWLGFGERRAFRPPAADGFADGFGCSRCEFDVGLADRLRLLVSGRLVVEVSHQVDRLPTAWFSWSAMGVPRPGKWEQRP
jgi:hypothetical protein